MPEYSAKELAAAKAFEAKPPKYKKPPKDRLCARNVVRISFAHIHQLRAESYTYESIAEHLNAQGVELDAATLMRYFQLESGRRALADARAEPDEPSPAIKRSKAKAKRLAAEPTPAERDSSEQAANNSSASPAPSPLVEQVAERLAAESAAPASDAKSRVRRFDKMRLEDL